MEVGRLTPDWFRILVGDVIDYSEVRGWRKTGRSSQVISSFTGLKTIRCIINGPQLEDVYDITEMSKSSIGDKTVAFTSRFLEGGMKSGTRSRLIDKAMEEIFDKQYGSGDDEITMEEEAQPTETSQTKIRKSTTGEGAKLSSLTSARPCRLFSLAEIVSATNKFDDDLVIGQGGFGKVYKGQITSEESGHVVAIKRLDSVSIQGEHEFWAEIDILCNFHHRHLVSLVGYCNDDQEKILVYEYMTHGSLSHHLHILHTPLSWETRLRIAIAVARVLDYLHTGVNTRHGIIHRNVKSTTILLDENWEAVISGLGLSITGPTDQSISYVEDVVKGTYGYADPEYIMTGKLTYKADVYSFGVVLFELLSGRHAIQTSYGKDETPLIKWARKCVKVKKLEQMIDSNIKGTISSECLRLFAQTADRCVHDVSEERPNMGDLVASLEALLELQEKFDRTPATKPNSDASGTSLWRRMKGWLFR